MSRNGIALGMAVLLGVGPTSPGMAAQRVGWLALGQCARRDASVPGLGACLQSRLPGGPRNPRGSHRAGSGRPGAAPPRRVRHLDADSVRVGRGSGGRLSRTGGGSVERPKPPPSVDRSFRDHIARALELAERRLRDDESDPDAHFQLEGRRAGALEEYRMAVRLCRAGNDRLCSYDANRLIRTPYR